eukprot:685806-Rhodomonas_salina.1
MVNSDTVEQEVDKELAIMRNGGGEGWLNGDGSIDDSGDDEEGGGSGDTSDMLGTESDRDNIQNSVNAQCVDGSDRVRVASDGGVESQRDETERMRSAGQDTAPELR